MHMTLYDLWDLPVSVYAELVEWVGEQAKGRDE